MRRRRLAGYRRRADELLTGDEQDAIIDLVACEPTCGDLIVGTGGLRKVRVGPGAAGKRGGAGSSTTITIIKSQSFFWRSTQRMRKALTPAEKKEFAGLLKELVAQWRRK